MWYDGTLTEFINEVEQDTSGELLEELEVISEEFDDELEDFNNFIIDSHGEAEETYGQVTDND